ncbi:MAG: ATP-binding cassette domain-containing protein [Eubacteriales bacterium]|nr:ATP-binding cassette domain-containing protein [Eubacteriales bacterium]
MALVTCRDVAFAYEGNVVASQINLTVEKNDCLYILGENGSGKTTLVKGLLGLMQPCKGSIVLGEGLTRRDIGYLPQRSDAQKDFPASVWEVVCSGCAQDTLFLTADVKKKAMNSLELLSIANLKKQSFQALSGGQQQRVLLARALCATRKLLLMDEPVAGLDPLAMKEMYETIDRLHREQGVAVVTISHDVPAALKYASHILHLRHEPLFFGTAEDYAASPLCRAFGGGRDDA